MRGACVFFLVGQPSLACCGSKEPADRRNGQVRSFPATTHDSRAGAHVQTSLPQMPHHQQPLEREEWFAAREVALLEREVVPLSFFQVHFQSRFLLRELTMRRSRLDDIADDRTSRLQEAECHALRSNRAHCENAILPIDCLRGRLVWMIGAGRGSSVN